jgi:hypothetical protein
LGTLVSQAREHLPLLLVSLQATAAKLMQEMANSSAPAALYWATMPHTQQELLSLYSFPMSYIPLLQTVAGVSLRPRGVISPCWMGTCSSSHLQALHYEQMLQLASGQQLCAVCM